MEPSDKPMGEPDSEPKADHNNTNKVALPEYQCHKVVQGAKIIQVNIFHDGAELILDVLDGQPISHHVSLEWHNRHRPEYGDYLVRYDDGYESKSPADPFDDGYHRINREEQMTFGRAIKMMDAGKRVARLGWNGPDMYIVLVPGSTFKVNQPPWLGIYAEGSVINYLPHIDIRTAQGDIVPWAANQPDMLARDWVLVD